MVSPEQLGQERGFANSNPGLSSPQDFELSIASCRWSHERLECDGDWAFEGFSESEIRSAWSAADTMCWEKFSGERECLAHDALWSERDVDLNDASMLRGLVSDSVSCGLYESGSVQCVRDTDSSSVRLDLVEVQEIDAWYGRVYFRLTDALWWANVPANRQRMRIAPTAVRDSAGLVSMRAGHYRLCGVRPQGDAVCLGRDDLQAHFIEPLPGDDVSGELHPIEGTHALTWVGHVGVDTFCGGGEHSREVQCWGAGPSPLLRTPRSATVHDSGRIDFARRVTFQHPVADADGFAMAACYVTWSGEMRCRTTLRSFARQCGAEMVDLSTVRSALERTDEVGL